MRILGLDYGKAKIGLALGESGLSEPYIVIRYSDTNILHKKLLEIIQKENVQKIVVGISEGLMEEESKKFSSNLKKIVTLPIETFDETLSTRDAQELSRSAGINRKKRHQMEDAFAASVMLQSYLDTNV